MFLSGEQGIIYCGQRSTLAVHGVWFLTDVLHPHSHACGTKVHTSSTHFIPILCHLSPFPPITNEIECRLALQAESLKGYAPLQIRNCILRL